MVPVKILYAEDDETLAFLTKDNLEQNNYQVTHCADGAACLARFKKEKFDICILDIMLPKIDGFELTSLLREMDPEVPIVFLSAKTLKEDRIKGLKLGADDYLVKPFSVEELILKVEVFLNRRKKTTTLAAKTYQVGRLTFDVQNYALTGDKKVLTLTERESELLGYFIEHKEKVLKREQILKAVWGNDDYFMGRSLDVFVSRLRKILSGQGISIQNIHGVGFKYSESKIDPGDSHLTER